MSTGSLETLRDKLDDGLSIVARIWEYKTKSWVSSICAADIDDDGAAEVIACSREGRVYLFSSTGDLLWKRVVGMKAWVGVATVGDHFIDGERAARVVVGTRDGKIYMLDKDGRTITRDGRALPFNEEGRALDLDEEGRAYWYDTKYVIRQIYVDPQRPSEIIIGSEDRCAYGLDALTGEPIWRFRTEAQVRTVFAYDVNGDGETEILLGSADRHIYILDHRGGLIVRYNVHYPVRMLTVADVDKDGTPEILVTTDNKALMALIYHPDPQPFFTEKWRQQFTCRLPTLCITDLDNDGHNEIVTSTDDQHIYILDDQGHIIWRHDHKYNIYSIFPYDIDKDGRPELLIGTEQERVRAMRIRLRKGVEKQVRRYYRLLGSPDPDQLVELTPDERSLLRDILQMGERELVSLEQAQEQIRACAYEQALVTLLKLQQQKVERLWHKDTIGHIRTLCLRRTTNEARREIVFLTYEGNVHSFHSNGRPAWSVALPNHVIDMQTGFVDQNKQEDVILCATDERVCRVYVIDAPERQREIFLEDALTSSICVLAPYRQSQPEIILGSEDNKISLYGNDLDTAPHAVVPTAEGVKIVRAQKPLEENMPEIFMASLRNRVSAYTRSGKCLWSYKTRDTIRAIEIRDINGDGQAEILVGSEDRNLHVLDSAGHLLWRYFLAQNVLAVDAIDINQDQKIEILVGCQDGRLYVFSRDGDLLWTYQARDRINALRVDDVDGDGNLEIATGSEDDFELLRVVNQQQVSTLIAQCWTAWREQRRADEPISALINNPEINPFLQAFALNKLVEHSTQIPAELDLERIAARGSVVMRNALAALTPVLYQFDPARIYALLYQLSTDRDRTVRHTMIDNLPALMNYDWEAGASYLKRVSEHSDRFLRRRVMRKLYQLIDTSAERSAPRRRDIFNLLLAAAQDKDSEWVRQEAARTLAQFLDQNYGSLNIYVHLFLVKEIDPLILKQITHTSLNTIVKRYITATIQLLIGLNEENVYERLQEIIHSQELASNLMYGEDLGQVYGELARLFTLLTLEEIASYECMLKINTFDKKNMYARHVFAVFEQLNVLICRPLKIYFQRESIHDRLASLLDSLEAFPVAYEYIEQHYTRTLLGVPLTNLPDRKIFALALNKWNNLIQAHLNELRGAAEIGVELQTRDVAHEEQVSIWLALKNIGRSSASNLKVTLLYSDYFTPVGDSSFETEVLAPGEEITAEFTFRPRLQRLALKFEIAFNNVDRTTRVERYEDYLTLREHFQNFHPIPNPYSTGIPIHDSSMFYGRGEDMAILENNLTRNVKSVIVLYGQRRSGKTTLLVQLINTLGQTPHIPVMIDMQRTSYHITVESFLRRVAYYIMQAMKRKDILLPAPGVNDFKTDPTHTFDVFLDQVEELLANRKLILLIDEFEVLEEQVVKGNLQPEIFEYLRDIVQHRHFIHFLFAGTHKITEYTKWYRSIFFNIAFHHRLSRLDPLGAEDLIKKPVESYLEYEPVTVRKIRQLTADQPYLIHLMCRAIVDYCNDQSKTYVTINDVNIVLRKVMQTGEFHLDWLWDQIKPEERVALAALAEGGREEGRWLAFVELEEIYHRNRIHYKHEYILDALKTLLDADIIDSEPNSPRKNTLDSHRFKIPVGLTRRWLLREHPLEIVRKEMNG